MSADAEWLSAEEAAVLLDVKRSTLYAYVSRKKVRSAPAKGGRGRRYLRSDLLRLSANSRARRGHGAVAAGALSWGEPVLDSAITEITDAGPRYRGYLATDLADRVSFERVAELLWTGELPRGRRWPACTLGARVGPLRTLVPKDARPIERMLRVFPSLVTLAQDGELDAPLTVRRLAASLAIMGRTKEVLSAATIARAFAIAMGCSTDKKSLRAIDAGLVMIADHELNASSFGARVTASAGAGVGGAVLSALVTVSGTEHGAACDRFEGLVDEIGRPEHTIRVLRGRWEQGERILGFGHRLYPAGDPRGRYLLELAFRIGGGRRLAVVRSLVDAVELAGGELPSVEVGLVALGYALRLPPGGAVALFALGRSAGWIAHAREQKQAPLLVRPRARYIGSEQREL